MVVQPGSLAGPLELPIASLGFSPTATSHILEQNLFLSPSVGEYCVRRSRDFVERFKLEGRGIEEPHNDVSIFLAWVYGRHTVKVRYAQVLGFEQG